MKILDLIRENYLNPICIMYYDRTISPIFETDLSSEGIFSWLIPYVKAHDDLDILIGKNAELEFCSVYRGTTRILRIHRTIKGSIPRFDAAEKYMQVCPEMFAESTATAENLEKIRVYSETHAEFDRYYNNHKEGYHQNLIQRKFGLLSTTRTELVIVDKEVVIGYANQQEKEALFNREQIRYKKVRTGIQQTDPKKFGTPNDKKPLGNELDLIALDKDGYIHLMELKIGSNASGISMSPLQIGLYNRLFKMIDIKDSIVKMVRQKQRLGLIDADWKVPDIIQSKIIPELIICNYNPKSSCYPDNYKLVMENIKLHAPDIYEDIRDIKVRDENMQPL